MLEQELLESPRRGSGVQILINKDGAAAALAPAVTAHCCRYIWNYKTASASVQTISDDTPGFVGSYV